MTLIIILLAIGLQRYLDVLTPATIPNWFILYLQSIQKIAGKLSLGNHVLGIIIILVPIMLVVGLVDWLFGSFLFGIFKLIFGLIVLWYILDARDLKARLGAYFVALTKNDSVTAAAEGRTFALNQTLDDTIATSALARTVTNQVFWHSAERTFGILFWFILLGPAAAVGYYLVITLRDAAATVNLELTESLIPATQLANVLDWLPTRFIAVAYALVGHFTVAFNYISKHILDGVNKTRELAINSGLAALGIEHVDVIHADAEENLAAISLVDRAIILWIVVVAVFTLGGWLH